MVRRAAPLPDLIALFAVCVANLGVDAFNGTDGVSEELSEPARASTTTAPSDPPPTTEGSHDLTAAGVAVFSGLGVFLLVMDPLH